MKKECAIYVPWILKVLYTHRVVLDVQNNSLSSHFSAVWLISIFPFIRVLWKLPEITNLACARGFFHQVLKPLLFSVFLWPNGHFPGGTPKKFKNAYFIAPPYLYASLWISYSWKCDVLGVNIPSIIQLQETLEHTQEVWKTFTWGPGTWQQKNQYT